MERGHLIARLIRMRSLRGIGAADCRAIVLGLAVAAAIGVTAVPGVARAACAPSPSLSPQGFTGTVVRLGTDHRQAFVETDDGAQIEVDGGAIGPGIGGEDYLFVLGGRYRIEPDNARPPFLVNDCTATTLLGVVSLSPSPPTSASPSTSASTSALPLPISSLAASAELTVFPTPAAHPDFVTGAIFLVLSALLLAAAFGVRAVRRRLHRT